MSKTTAKPAANQKTLAKIRAQAKGRSWLASLTPEERATCLAVREEHHGPNGPLNITGTLEILRQDFKKRIVSIRVFGDWMREKPPDQPLRGFVSKATEDE